MNHLLMTPLLVGVAPSFLGIQQPPLAPAPAMVIAKSITVADETPKLRKADGPAAWIQW